MLIKNSTIMNPKIYECPSDRILISIVYVCDGKADCLSGEDEENCFEEDNFRFTCLNSKEKIQFTQICDFIQDCPDASDENFCGRKQKFFMR